MLLNPITTPRKKRNFATFDLEWVPPPQLPGPEAYPVVDGVRQIPKDRVRYSETMKLRVAGYYDGEHYQHFTTIRELLEITLTRANRGKWFYAHAGGLADIQFVFDEIIRQSKELGAEAYQVNASFSGSSAIIVKVKRGKSTWIFIDSYWLLRDSLKNIGKSLGKEKLDDDKKQTQEEIRKYFTETPIEKLIPYNRVDCEILYDAVKNFEATVNSIGGQLQMTIASTGMNLFRRASLKQDIRTSAIINELSKQSYYSSRVEVQGRNAEDFKIFDFNSSFPFSMTFPCPAGLKRVGTKLPEDPDAIYMADVVIEVPDMYLPPVPHRVNGRVFFPIGRWRSWLTSVDIQLAIREGCTIHKVHAVYEFYPFSDLKDYVDTVYGKRREAKDDFEKLVYKYLLNCLYGKFAESPFKQEMIINPEEPDHEKMIMLQPGVWFQENVVAVTHMHVPISAHVTSLSRKLLYDGMKECIRQGKPVYYCDTDSIATTADLPTDDKKLGCLKLEKKMTWGEFVAPKIYRGEGFELQKDGTWKAVQVAKAKGFSIGKGQEAMDKIDHIILGEKIGVQRMVRIRELMRNRPDDSTPIETMVIKALTFEALSKRHHYPDGETRPWSIGELYSGNRHTTRLPEDVIMAFAEPYRKMIEATQ